MAAKKPRRKNRANKIADLLAAIEEKLQAEAKCTVSEYIRLLQVQQELEKDTPRDIEVTWVDSRKAKSDSDK